MQSVSLQNPNLTETERAAVKAQAQTRGIGAALGLLGGLVAAAAERARKQEERAEQRAARKEKQIEAEMQALSAPPQEWKAAAQAYLAQKALASPVRQSYPDSLTPADDEPPTFWDKLKQLWDAFWNWVTGKSTTPSPTATPVISHEPTSALLSTFPTTPTPTPTPSPTPTSPPTLTPTFQPLPEGYARYSPYWYGQTYFDLLNNTDGWWHSYQGQPFGMKTYIAAVYNYEIASFANVPSVREYFTEAFARRYWQSQIDYGPDGAFWYLGGRDMVRLRVLNNIPGISENEYNFKQSFDEAERILNNSIWKQGISWSSPYDWRNPTEKTKTLLPSFWKVLQNGIAGTQANQILVSPGKDFFIVTQEQIYTLCGNQSCVNPSYLYP